MNELFVNSPPIPDGIAAWLLSNALAMTGEKVIKSNAGIDYIHEFHRDDIHR